MEADWSWRTIPELEGLPPAERDRVWRRCALRSWLCWQSWLILAAGSACGAVVSATAKVVTPWLGLPEFIFDIPSFLFIAAAGGSVSGLITVTLWTRYARRHLREYLRSRCHDCGYDLTGNVSGLCPECGRRLSEAERSP